MKLFAILFLTLTYLCMVFAGEKECIPQGGKCSGIQDNECCPGTVCMTYARRCVQGGRIPRLHID
ncbi:hypothetical protein O3M35_009095 [Rhynocoris fuscipes]|uniref:Uncharacterized protein n=1 Tax=Rhynocoris fuscipes TaxID=488301 RepID=A0AAW1D1M4_9HEMI